MWMLNFLLLLINKIVFNSNHIQTDKFGTVEVTHTKIEKVYNLFLFLKLIPDCTSLTGPPKKLASDKTLRMLLMTRKSPLSKSLSMPDMETRVKKRERLMA
jgi:hypothetical protein